MAANAKEKKQKKEIAKKIIEAKGINYNEWLHQQHVNYIDENLIEYMEMNDKKEDKEQPQSSISSSDTVTVKNSDDKNQTKL
jgi:hypothetical protein